MATTIINPDAMELGQLSLLCATVGVLAHLLYFIREYRVSQATGIMFFHLISSCLILGYSIYTRGIVEGSVRATAASSSYLLGLYSSMTIYRVFFHRLSRFPGPLAAKITKLYGPYLARNGKMHLEQNKLMERYGNVVRIGPNELLIQSIDAQQKSHGATSKCTKGNTIYTTVNYKGEFNLDTIPDRQEHRWRRQVWDKAMNTKALISYEKYAREVVYEWLDKLQSIKGQPINTSLYSTLIPFENMGRMGFSKDFGSIKAGKEDPMLRLIGITFSAIGKLGQLPWPGVIASELSLSGEHSEFEKLACDMVDQRAKLEDDSNEDIMKYFLEDFHSEKSKSFHNRNAVYADAQAIMIAGTDTIAAVLSYAFYYMAKDRTIQQKLRAELKPLFGRTTPGEFANGDLGEADAEYLNAIINETMRIDNPTCNHAPRLTPPEGLEVDGVHIPGGIALFIPIHAMHRSEQYFVEPTEFIPERWTTRPELILEKRAFHPFLLGPYNCVGRRLALLVVRFVLAYTVWNYDFEFAPGEDGVAIHRDAVNQLIIKAGHLNCVFHARN